MGMGAAFGQAAHPPEIVQAYGQLLLKICIKLLGKGLALKASNQMNLLLSLTKNSGIWRHI